MTKLTIEEKTYIKEVINFFVKQGLEKEYSISELLGEDELNLKRKLTALQKENAELKQIIHHLRSQLAERDELMED